ncbi:Cyclin mcs2, partial [Grifola frondosa]
MTAEPTPSSSASSPTSSSSHGLSLYEGSTQFRHWRFSPEQLAQTRASLNITAVSAIRDAFEADAARLPCFIPYLGSSSEVQFLNADEEHLLVKLYVGKIAQLCAHFRFPEEVEATAVTYLKRFYLKNTVMDWHPKNVILHFPHSKTIPSDVLDLEFLVAQSLGFDFAVWHPHRALWGIWLDIQNLPDAPIEKLRKDYEIALSHVRASRLTDAEFIYTPSQIALACFSLASPSVASAWAHSKFPTSENPLVLAVLEPIKAIITTDGSPPEVEAVREVDRRLKLCKNPEKIVGSNAYKKKQEERAKRADEKRKRKAEEVRRAMEEGDPFGSELAEEAALDDDDDDD